MFNEIIKNFTLGDFIYGFREDRAPVLEALNEHYSQDEKEPFIVDDYNSLAQFLWRQFNQPSYSALSKDAVKAKALHDFAGKFEEPNNHNYRGYYGGTSNFYDELNGGTCAFIKKRCKLGILWQIQNGRKVHFLLSERVKFNECFKEKKDKYTYSEFRFVYRNWNDLLPYYQKGLIKFWKKDDNTGQMIEVPPPWQSAPGLVGEYAPRKSTKDARVEKRKRYSLFFNGTMCADDSIAEHTAQKTSTTTVSSTSVGGDVNSQVSTSANNTTACAVTEIDIHHAKQSSSSTWSETKDSIDSSTTLSKQKVRVKIGGIKSGMPDLTLDVDETTSFGTFKGQIATKLNLSFEEDLNLISAGKIVGKCSDEQIKPSTFGYTLHAVVYKSASPSSAPSHSKTDESKPASHKFFVSPLVEAPHTASPTTLPPPPSTVNANPEHTANPTSIAAQQPTQQLAPSSLETAVSGNANVGMGPQQKQQHDAPPPEQQSSSCFGWIFTLWSFITGPRSQSSLPPDGHFGPGDGQPVHHNAAENATMSWSEWFWSWFPTNPQPQPDLHENIEGDSAHRLQ